ncbi:MAG: SHOCT domain-containing protein [Acidimicrobiales bacterium]
MSLLLAAEFGSGQVLWSIFWFFLFFMWIWLVITIFVDVMRSDDLSGVAKALWALAIIVLPFLGVFLYLIVRGGSMGDRAVDAANERDAATRAYIANAAGSGGSADELAKLADLHANGTLSDDEYAAAKAKALNS